MKYLVKIGFTYKSESVYAGDIFECDDPDYVFALKKSNRIEDLKEEIKPIKKNKKSTKKITVR